MRQATSYEPISANIVGGGNQNDEWVKIWFSLGEKYGHVETTRKTEAVVKFDTTWMTHTESKLVKNVATSDIVATDYGLGLTAGDHLPKPRLSARQQLQKKGAGNTSACPKTNEGGLQDAGTHGIKDDMISRFSLSWC